MILTCPSCGTQYAVKDGAIPPQGRQVRCASCKHAWHQDPEGGAVAAPQEPAPYEPPATDDVAAEDAPGGSFDDPGERFEEAPAAEPADYAPADPVVPVDPVAPPGEALVEDTPAGGTGQWSPPASQAREEEPPPYEAPQAQESAYDVDFSPFTMEDDEPRERSPLLKVLIVALLIAALAAAFWFLAPPEWKERVGISAAGETPLQLMMTHTDRQKIAPSGNELLSVSGRVINPTDEAQNVPPIRAQLRSSSGKLVYSWTIAPPARTLAPGDSRTFNSTEVNVPSGGDQLTITLGAPKT
jgi:predicted Zn finger-like uncharacterized protein